MEGKIVVVPGLSRTSADAEEILDRLTAEGFSSDDISVLLQSPLNGKRASGTLGLLAGFGPIEIPDTARLLAAGPVRDEIEVSRAAGSGGAGLAGLLTVLGIPQSDAQQTAERIYEGGVLLSAHCRSDLEVVRASQIFSHTPLEQMTSAPPVSTNGILSNGSQWPTGPSG